MIGRAVEKGLSSVVARWMLQGASDAILDRVAATSALEPSEIEALRKQSRAKLERVRDDGAPFVAMFADAAAAMVAQGRGGRLGAALRQGSGSLVPSIAELLRAAASTLMPTEPAAEETRSAARSSSTSETSAAADSCESAGATPTSTAPTSTAPTSTTPASTTATPGDSERLP